jgi:hypothetical protein
MAGLGRAGYGCIVKLSRHPGVSVITLVWGLGLALEPRCATAQPIACGQTITNSLGSAGQTASYTFTAQPGETFDILVLGQGFNPAAEVYDPAGGRLATCTNNFSGPLTVGTPGTCTIRVHADDLVSTGSYGISLSFLTGKCGQPLLWGLPPTNTVTKLAELDLYTFSGNAGETATLNSSGAEFAVAAFVAAPNGAILANWLNGTASLSLTNTGTYTVGIYSFYLGGTGSYSLSLSMTNLVPACYRVAIGTTNRAAALSIWGQVGRYTTIEYATSLSASAWLPLTNLTLPWCPYRLVDWASTNSAPRFYRTVQ